jgi:hypothetical protein
MLQFKVDAYDAYVRQLVEASRKILDDRCRHVQKDCPIVQIQWPRVEWKRIE